MKKKKCEENDQLEMLEAAMDIDLPTEVGPTEETVEALMEYLVCPFLSLKHTGIANETPSEAQKESVAKQVHAAAVLYNYFHRNQHRETKFLQFDQFCNLAIMFQPSILHHMKYMCESNRPILDDPENQLSPTEKAIMDACHMSKTLLSASDNISNIIKEWSVTKVAVLLIDSKKENCYLKLENGVWSAIEKDLYHESEKHKGKMLDHDEDGFQKLAFSAVKEATENVNGELKVLESHVVYSLSQAKTATLFYIVQSTQAISEDDLVPIQDAICSLQGPVVKESLGSWVTTPVVECYYLLPYAKIMSKWYSRVSNTSSHHMEKKSADTNIFQALQKSCVNASGNYNGVSVNLQIKSKLDSESVHVSNSSKHELPVNKFTKNRFEPKISSNNVVSSWLVGCPVDQKVKETKDSTDNRIMDASSDSTNEDMIKSCRVEHNENLENLKRISTINQSKDEMVGGENKSYMVSPHVDITPTMNHALEDFYYTADLKKSELSQAALRALQNKRQKLSNQQEVIERELALCNKKIQAFLHGGTGDCLGLKLEAIIDCCNEICKQDDMQTKEHTSAYVARSTSLLSGQNLSEAHPTLRKACKELEDICLSNNWMLPVYHTSLSDDGVVANVTVKGTDFECSVASGVQPSIHEARNSAATNATTRLHQMASELNITLP